MTKIKTLPINNYSFRKEGTVTCKVNSGSVTVQLNGGNAAIYNADKQGNGNQFSKTKNDDNAPKWSVTVKKVGDKKVEVIFTAPDSDD